MTAANKQAPKIAAALILCFIRPPWTSLSGGALFVRATRLEGRSIRVDAGHDVFQRPYAPSLDGFLTLKERWGTSVAAMIMRSKQLDLIDDDDARRLWINYNRRGWRNGEPLDGKLQKEEPHLIRRSFELLLEEGVQSTSEIVKALPFPTADLEELADLEPGTLSGETLSRAAPILKDAFRQDSNVVSIFGSKD